MTLKEGAAVCIYIYIYIYICLYIDWDTADPLLLRDDTFSRQSLLYRPTCTADGRKMFPLPVGNVLGECRLTILSSSETELKTKEIFFN